MRMCWSLIKVLAGAGVYLSLNIKEADKPHILQLIEYWYLCWMIYLSLKAQLWWYDMILLWLGILGTCLTFWTVFDSRESDRYLQYNSAWWGAWVGLQCSSFLCLSFTGYTLRSKRRGRVPATSSSYYAKCRGKLIWYQVRFPVSWYAVYINI